MIDDEDFSLVNQLGFVENCVDIINELFDADVEAWGRRCCFHDRSREEWFGRQSGYIMHNRTERSESLVLSFGVH